MPLRLTLALSLTLLSQSLAQPPSRPKPPRFSAIIAERFDAWDADHNSTLSPDEIDKLVVDPSIHSEQAAALAAMKLVVRSTKIKVPDLTRDFLANHSDDPAGENLDQPTTTDTNAHPARPPASLQRRFESSLRRIKSAKRELFTDETPDIDHCHQGPLGDCFVVAGIGALAHRDPESIKSMIKPAADGAYEVRFANDKTIRTSALTDAEFALTSTTGDEGFWICLLEKAYGKLRADSRPQSTHTEESTDAISHGGSLRTTLQALTGHAIDSITLRSKAIKSDEQAATIAATARTRLAAAMADHRLAGCGTGSEKYPPGINAKHAYAILGFDLEADTVHLWNPHGNTFNPKGTPGLETGYPTKAGQFDMPTKDFVKVFSSMVIETGRAPDRRAR